jgi:hypothetical protein
MKLFKFYVTRDEWQDHTDGISYHIGATYAEGIVVAKDEDDAKSQINGWSYMKWDCSKDEHRFDLIGTAVEGLEDRVTFDDRGVKRRFVLSEMGHTGRVWEKNRPCGSPPASRNAGNAA